MNMVKLQDGRAMASYMRDLGNEHSTLLKTTPVGLAGPWAVRTGTFNYGGRVVNRANCKLCGHFGFARYYRSMDYVIGDPYVEGEVYWKFSGPTTTETQKRQIQYGSVIKVDEDRGWKVDTSGAIVPWCKGGQEVTIGAISYP
jgi:hypothetical protein